MNARSDILLPLYIYPSPGAWNQLYTQIEAHPHVVFSVVINPYNGPGPDAVPDENYRRELVKLNTYSNTIILGYVHTTYCTRKESLVARDIQTYAAWSAQSTVPGLAVDGIFFDETPWSYSNKSFRYLEKLARQVKTAVGIKSDRTTLFNPGCVPDSRYLALADNTLVCEASYSTFRSEEVVQALSTVNYDKSKLSVVIHSVPDSIVSNTAEFSQLIDHVRSSAYRAFVTDLSVDYYATFGSSWVDFVNLMAAKMSH